MSTLARVFVCRSVAAIASAACIISPLSAFAEDDPKLCAMIRDDSKRLECYDLVFKKTAIISTKNEWDVREETSKIDDSKNITLHLKSMESIIDQYGQSSPMGLWIMCREKKADLYFTFAGNFMSSTEAWGKVTYRIDKQPAATKTFKESTDHEALGLWGGGASIPFIKELFGASTLLVRATPFNRSSVTAEFNIVGLREAIVPLQKVCRWSAEATTNADIKTPMLITPRIKQ
jgi:type VI secretion system protein VasI